MVGVKAGRGKACCHQRVAEGGLHDPAHDRPTNEASSAKL